MNILAYFQEEIQKILEDMQQISETNQNFLKKNFKKNHQLRNKTLPEAQRTQGIESLA